MDGYVFKKDVDNNEVLDARLQPLVKGMLLKEDQGILVKGLIMSRDADGKGIPFQTYAAIDLTGAVDDANKEFTYDGAGFGGELAPGSVVIAHGDQELKDDGHGHLYGDGSGTVNYITGAVTATFTAAPAADSGSPTIVASLKPVAVILRAADTSLNDDDKPKNDVGAAVFFGAVARDRISANGSDPTDAEVALLEASGVYALF